MQAVDPSACRAPPQEAQNPTPVPVGGVRASARRQCQSRSNRRSSLTSRLIRVRSAAPRARAPGARSADDAGG